MSYKDELFTRYGSPCKDAEIKIWGYLTRPDDCAKFEDIRRNDNNAARLIADCKRLISQLTEYRQDLAGRYSALATMPSKDSLELQRCPHIGGGITYHIRHFTEYEDGTRVETETETFPGKERRAALKRFEELKKARPGIECKIDIEKRAWER